MEDMRNVYKILVGKPEGKRPLGRHRRREMEWSVFTGLIWIRIVTDGWLL
jgi:hypothetical protein